MGLLKKLKKTKTNLQDNTSYKYFALKSMVYPFLFFCCCFFFSSSSSLPTPIKRWTRVRLTHGMYNIIIDHLTQSK